MALKKLPCEYPELGIARAERLFDGWSDKEKIHFINAIEKCNNNLERIKREELILNNPHATNKHELQGGTK